jgi:hypothetical protein
LFYLWLTYQPESAIGSTTDISAVRTGGVEQIEETFGRGRVPGRRPWHSAREEDSLEEIGFDEDQEAVVCKTCSRCQAKMQLLGRLRGRETLAIVRLADGIDERLAESTPLLRLELIAELIKILAGAWRLEDVPSSIRDSMRNCPTDYLELSGLKALLERKLPMSMRTAQADEGVYTSGIPPPSRTLEVKA